MKSPNLKRFVLAVLKPSVWAIKMQYDYKVKDMHALTKKQTEQITSLEAVIAETNARLAELAARQVEYSDTVTYLRANLYTSAQIDELRRRSRELTHICSALYDKVYELLQSGVVVDPVLPPFENTWIPGDYILTDEELEDIWRKRNGFAPDDLLNPEQDALLVRYIRDYRKRHPGIPGTGEGGPDWQYHIPPTPSTPPDSGEEGDKKPEGGDGGGEGGDDSGSDGNGESGHGGDDQTDPDPTDPPVEKPEVDTQPQPEPPPTIPEGGDGTGQPDGGTGDGDGHTEELPPSPPPPPAPVPPEGNHGADGSDNNTGDGTETAPAEPTDPPTSGENPEESGPPSGETGPTDQETKPPSEEDKLPLPEPDGTEAVPPIEHAPDTEEEQQSQPPAESEGDSVVSPPPVPPSGGTEEQSGSSPVIPQEGDDHIDGPDKTHEGVSPNQEDTPSDSPPPLVDKE